MRRERERERWGDEVKGSQGKVCKAKFQLFLRAKEVIVEEKGKEGEGGGGGEEENLCSAFIF